MENIARHTKEKLRHHFRPVGIADGEAIRGLRFRGLRRSYRGRDYRAEPFCKLNVS